MTTSTIKTKRAKAKKLGVLKRRARNVCALSFTVIVFTTLLFRMDALNVGRVDIIGASEQGAEIASVASGILDQNYLFVIPKSNVLLLPRRRIMDAILADFPHLLSAKPDISRSLDSLRITVAERQSYAVWCANQNGAQQCFYIDKEGIVFSKAPIFSGKVLFTYRGGLLETLPNFLGERIMPSDQFQEIVQFISDLKKAGLSARELSITSYGYELMVGDSLKIFVGRENLDISISNIKAAIRSGNLKTDADYLDTLEYIDLRFDSRIYYKYR